jgi:hypothetical protein
MQQLRQFGLGVLLLLALSLPAMAGEISCPGEMGQPQTQVGSSITGDIGNPCKAGDMGMPCLEGNIGCPLDGDIGFPAMEALLSLLF